MKTLEFKLDLNQAERRTIEQWLSVLRWVWNEGLGLLIENDTFSAYCKDDKKRYGCCPMPWEYRWRLKSDSPIVDQPTEGAKKDWIPISYTPIAYTKPYRQFCPIPQYYREPRLDMPTSFSLSGYFAHKRHSDKPWLKAVPANFIRGTLHSLSISWERYKSGKGGKPKFKRKGDVLGSLVHEDGKSIGIKGDLVRIPKLGTFRVRHLIKQWGEVPIKVLKVVKRPSGYYLQLTGDVPVKALKASALKVGLALPQKGGLLYVDDRGKEVLALPEDEKLSAKLLKLQQQLSRQTYLGENWQKTKQKIARIHELTRMRAKNYNHKLSTFLVRTYGSIAVQEVKTGALPTPAPIVASIEPPSYDPNGASRIAEINQRRVALRVGQFVELVKQKSGVGDRAFVKAKPSKSDADYAIIAQDVRTTQ